MVADMPPHRFLVMARAGDGSLHRRWLHGADRRFDLYLSYYGDQPGKHAAEVEHWREMKSTKWPALHAHVLADRELIERYDAVWFPDDDLLMDAAGINRMFDLFTAFGLSLAQPSLTPNSHFSHSAVLRDPDYVVRHVNFVEVMGPVFSRDALRILHPTFAQSRIGWGLDYLWPHLLHRDNPAHRIGLIDATPMVHTRPVGGGEIYKGRAGFREDDLAKLSALYPEVDFRTSAQRAQFRIDGGARVVGPRPAFVARLCGRWHRFWAKRVARRTPRYPE